ncbi:hypothetical protein GGI35DRAFT_198255 [Trichoderma velutinum]
MPVSIPTLENSTTMSMLLCPRCRSDTTDIVSPENDARLFIKDDDSKPETPQLRHRFPPQGHDHGHGHDHDHDHDHDCEHGHDQAHGSDQSEPDIEDSFGGPNGLLFHRFAFDCLERQYHDSTFDSMIDRHLVRYLESNQDFQSSRLLDIFAQRVDEGRFRGPHIHRALFIGGGGSASVTNSFGPEPGLFWDWILWERTLCAWALWICVLWVWVLWARTLWAGTLWAETLWAGVFGVGTLWVWILFGQDFLDRDAFRPRFPDLLQALLFSDLQEGLQSNGAPPASTDTLANLDRRPVDDSMLELDPKGCAICKEDMKVGDDATILPCQHRFHDGCVNPWLSGHNTCPVCRADVPRSLEKITSTCIQARPRFLSRPVILARHARILNVGAGSTVPDRFQYPEHGHAIR